ncbi:sensor histidine kinase [Psychrobium sp. 1_MG-2023]|uniref:sensor histidine kinase n=1 Tax=Psychrobium sp. 1_MG-2023 TaxID=3062624 RepID=UPI000C333AEF|nr:histidine kinase [Psychrobium sp. 1_MG-2023]MDP2562916.1 histidine kinase [Psychrobium sp. 1_MG-2023]PKF53756.1 hypothetical protein CW748_17700 [Alteromonadales bacterium alter-6D02]
MMKLYFFPRDPRFWLYHCTALIAVIAVDLFTSANNGQINVNIAKVSALFALLFTATTLSFRFVFNKQSWYKTVYHKQIPGLLLAGTFMSLLSTSSIIVISYYTPFFHSIYSSYIGENTSLATAFQSAFMVKQCLQTQLFICSWIFIYTSITHQRHATNAQMLSLQLENSLKSAQLENLNTQLNPHFLFNALNNIRFMIAESVEMADDMMVTLSELLRYALEISQSHKVPLHIELDMLDKYMQLIKMQYEDKLSFSVEEPENSHAIMIPPMMLQLLVENAVKYGVERSTKAGHISLTSSQNTHSVTLKLANSLPTQNDESTASMQIGLNNIRDRLTLLYGSNASFNTEVLNEAFVATLCLPKEKQ